MKNSLFISGIIILLIFASSNSFGDNQWISIGLEGESVSALAINPQTPDTLYAGTGGGGVFKSTDGGTNWTAMNNGFTNTTDFYVWVLAINPQTPDTLYAGALYAGAEGNGVFKSTDGGTHWTAMNNGLTYLDLYVSALAINPQAPDTLYAGTSGTHGMFKSTNGGANWTTMNNGLPKDSDSFFPPVDAFAINPQAPDTLYAGTWGEGVFKSTNGGANWTAMNNGLTNTNVRVLAIDPQIPATLYAGTGGSGVFKLVGPVMNISVTTTSVNFGNVNVGQPTNQTITITNQASSTEALAGNVGTLSAPFSVVSGGGAFNLAPGQSIMVTVQFSPKIAGPASASLSITHNATNRTSPTNISLSGTGVTVPIISVTPTSNNYGNVKLKTSKPASFMVKNSGKANLSITSTITGADTSMFTITSGGGSKTIKPGKTLTIKVAFKPTSKGSKSANLEITSNDPATPTLDIPLSGRGQ